MTTQTLAPVEKVVTVGVPPERAFEVFTRQLGAWWPVDKFSIADPPDAIVFEEREGGEVFETKGDARHHWAWVRAWDPPRRFALEWKVNPETAGPTDVEVSFEPDGDGTRVTLVHTGWEKLGAEAAEGRAGYDGGWVLVLGRYEGHFKA